MDNINSIIKKYDNGTVEEIILRSVLFYILPSFFNIPILGSVADIIYSEKMQKNQIKFLKNLIKDLDESKVDFDFLYSSEWFNMLKKTVYIVNDEIYEDKIIFYSILLKNSLMSTDYSRQYNVDYLKILANLSIQEIIVLREMYLQQKDLDFEKISPKQIEDRDWENLPIILNEFGIENKNLLFIFKRLESNGLICELTGTYIGYTGGLYHITYNVIDMLEKLDIMQLKQLNSVISENS